MHGIADRDAIELAKDLDFIVAVVIAMNDCVHCQDAYEPRVSSTKSWFHRETELPADLIFVSYIPKREPH